MGDLFYTSTCELCKRIHSALLAARACLSKSLASENWKRRRSIPAHHRCTRALWRIGAARTNRRLPDLGCQPCAFLVPITSQQRTGFLLGPPRHEMRFKDRPVAAVAIPRAQPAVLAISPSCVLFVCTPRQAKHVKASDLGVAHAGVGEWTGPRSPETLPCVAATKPADCDPASCMTAVRKPPGGISSRVACNCRLYVGTIYASETREACAPPVPSEFSSCCAGSFNPPTVPVARGPCSFSNGSLSRNLILT
jgi:hypothetical protein